MLWPYFDSMQTLKKTWTALWRIALFMLLWGVLMAPGVLLMSSGAEEAGAPIPPPTRLILEAFGAAAVLLAAWITLRYVDRRSFSSLGFASGRIGRDLIAGLVLGAMMILLALGTLWVPGWVSAVPGVSLAGSSLLLMAVAMLLNSVTQEVLVRGYILQAIEAQLGVAVALVASSIVFAGLHAGAIVEGGLLPAVNLFAAGLLLGLAYTTTRNLWLPIALHFSWNFLQGPVLGIAVSGQDLDSGWQLLTLNGPSMWTGGPFGLEGGLGATLATAAGIAVLIAAARRRGRSVPKGEDG
jgi:membrane protease YdiL (CAAX protease family)